MIDQHAKIKGYRDLDEQEIAWMNHLKDMEENLRVVLNSLNQHCQQHDREAARWCAIARTHLETGFMFAIKAVARPTNGLGRVEADNRSREEVGAAQPPESDRSD